MSRYGGGGEIRSINKIWSSPSFLLVSPSSAIQYERCWCHSLIAGQVPPWAYSSHVVPPSHAIHAHAQQVSPSEAAVKTQWRESFYNCVLEFILTGLLFKWKRKNIQIWGKGYGNNTEKNNKKQNKTKKPTQNKKTPANSRGFIYQLQIPSGNGENLFSA